MVDAAAPSPGLCRMRVQDVCADYMYFLKQYLDTKHCAAQNITIPIPSTQAGVEVVAGVGAVDEGVVREVQAHEEEAGDEGQGVDVVVPLSSVWHKCRCFQVWVWVFVCMQRGVLVMCAL